MTIQQELEQTRVQLSEAQARIEPLTKEVETLRTDKANLQTLNATAANEVNTLKASLEKEQAEVKNLTTEVTTIRSNIDKLAATKALEITQSQGVPPVGGKTQDVPANGGNSKPKTAAEAWNMQFKK